MLPQKFFKIRCSEIASEAIFVLKFIFGLDAARILGPSVFGAPLTMFKDRHCMCSSDGVWSKRSPYQTV